MKRSLIFVLLGMLVVATGIVYFSPIVDRLCYIEIKNVSDDEIILKTYKRADNELIVDSLILNPGNKIIIGYCMSCKNLDSSSLVFDTVGFFDENARTFKLMNREQLLNYLMTMDKVDCATFLIN